MKKTIAVVLVLLLVFGAFAGCASSGPPGKATDGIPEETLGPPEMMSQSSENPINSEPEEIGNKPAESGIDDTRDETMVDPEENVSPEPEPASVSTEPNTPTEEAGDTPKPTTDDTEPTAPIPTEPTPTNPAHTHSYVATVVAPTCTEKGYTLHKCSCGDSYKDTYTAAVGHNYVATVVAPTCTAQGYTRHQCSRCASKYDDNYTATIPHNYVLTNHVDPTYSSTGKDTYTCSMCGSSYTETIPMLVPQPATAADAQRCCDIVNAYIAEHYQMTDYRNNWFGVTWVFYPGDVEGSAQATIEAVDFTYQDYLNSGRYGDEFYCGYIDMMETHGYFMIILYCTHGHVDP